DVERAACLLMKAREDLHERGLARAVVAEYAQYFAVAERKRDAVERRHRAEAFDEVVAAQCERRAARTARGIRCGGGGLRLLHQRPPLRRIRPTWMLKII